MRYYTYIIQKENIEYVTMSEDDIRKDYFPHWYERMCKKYSKDYVDKTYSFEDCLDDWIIMYEACEVDDWK